MNLGRAWTLAEIGTAVRLLQAGWELPAIASFTDRTVEQVKRVLGPLLNDE